MPFCLYPLKTRKGFALKAWGPYSWDLGTTAKTCIGAEWKDRVILEDGSAVERCFTFPYFRGQTVVDDLLKVDPAGIIPKSVSDKFHIPPEAKRFRVTFRRELFLGESFKGSHQEPGLRRMITWSRFALFWEMRMGKTPILTAALNHHWVDKRFDKLLVIAPPESIYNFDNELKKWAVFYPEEEEAVYVADTKHRKPFQPHHRIVLTTYTFLCALMQEAIIKETGSRSKNFRKNRLTEIETWGHTRAIVLDEVHNIKNPKSLAWKTVAQIKDLFEFRYILSGTPAPQGNEDLWTQINFLDSSLSYPEYSQHVRTIAVVDGGRSGHDDTISSRLPEKEHEWLQSVSHLVSREIKPDRIENYIKNYWTVPTQKQLMIYRAFAEETLMKLAETEGGVIRPQILSNSFPYISLALDNPSLLIYRVEEGKIIPGPDSKLPELLSSWKFADHGKLPILDRLIEKYLEEDGEPKLIVWSTHPVTLDQLAEHYARYDPYVVHGSLDLVAGESRTLRNHKIVEHFKKSKRKILLASSLVLNSAIDLSVSFRSIFFDRPWNWAKYSQATARIFLDPVRPIEINPLVFERTLEVEQNERLETHTDRNNKLFLKKALSTEDIQNILNGRLLK